ncbi:Nucleosomal histone H3-Lys79 methylase, partial [Cladochytrium tenue]
CHVDLSTAKSFVMKTVHIQSLSVSTDLDMPDNTIIVEHQRVVLPKDAIRHPQRFVYLRVSQDLPARRPPRRFSSLSQGEGTSHRVPAWGGVDSDGREPVGDYFAAGDGNSHHPVSDTEQIVDAANVVFLTPSLYRSGIVKACNRKKLEDLKECVTRFNDYIISVRPVLSKHTSQASPDFVSFVLDQSYSRTVSPSVDLLRSYKGFSNYVYGEVNHALVSDFIEKTGLSADQCFLDMGSGTGTVVLQIAAQVLCEAHGIEKMANPFNLGFRQMKDFLARMKMYGKKCGTVTLRHGDFLEDDFTHQVITKADVIFVVRVFFRRTL